MHPSSIRPSLFVASLVLLSVGECISAEQTPSEKVISEAIATMSMKRDAIGDPIEQARIDKAIRELELLLDDSQRATPVLDIQVTPEILKKKFACKAIYDPKSGELSLKYDFPGRPQLADFDVGDKRVLVAKKMLAVEAGDELQHIAKFKTVNVSVTMAFKRMDGAGVGTSSGSAFTTGGTGHDAIQLTAGLGRPNWKVVPGNVRSGTIPVVYNVVPQKISLRYATEVLTTPNIRPDEVHQVILKGGKEGCGFSSLVITGVPDPTWFKDFLAGD